MYDAEIAKLEGMRLMMEKQIITMDSHANNKNVFETMLIGTKAVQELAKEADIDKFDEIREKHEELEDKNKEINDFFADYANDQLEDCEDELEDLEKELEADLKAELEADEEIDDIEDKPIKERKSKKTYVLINKI